MAAAAVSQCSVRSDASDTARAGRPADAAVSAAPTVPECRMRRDGHLQAGRDSNLRQHTQPRAVDPVVVISARIGSYKHPPPPAFARGRLTR